MLSGKTCDLFNDPSQSMTMVPQSLPLTAKFNRSLANTNTALVLLNGFETSGVIHPLCWFAGIQRNSEMLKIES